MSKSPVTVGTTFTYNYADSNATWTVKRARGGGTWDCLIEDDADYAGAKKVFSTEEIQSARNFAAAIDDIMSENDRFWADRRIGEVLHYHNGFGQFVRGEVVEGGLMMPTALVGNWNEYDLPRYHPVTREPIVPYHARKIADREPFQPNYSNIYEADEAVAARNSDPRDLEPIDLTLAPQTAIEALAARVIQIRCEAAKILGDLSIPSDEAVVKANALLAEIA